ncbi:MAG: hypothetical protein NC127_00515 [Muribaculum sp.]|nr:hypothetical protein [Muribaculum sp.]
MKSIYKLIFAGLSFAMPLVSCSDDDDYAPGEAVATDCPGVYFPVQSSYSYTFTTDDYDKSFNLTVKRLNTDGALSVPVSLTSEKEGFTAASTVEFADGQGEAIYKVDCENLPMREMVSATVTIPDSYFNTYAAGTNSVSFETIVAEWDLWAPNARFEFTDHYSPFNSDIYGMRGTRRLKIDNFLGSGLPLIVEVEDIDYSVTAYARLYPKSNFMAYDDLFSGDMYDCWYFYDRNREYWPIWSPDGSQPEIYFAMFYGYDADSNYKYTYICPTYLEGCFTGEFTYSDDSTGYNYVYFYYDKPLFEMFDEYEYLD